MRIKAITCEVFARAVYLNAALSSNIIDVTLVDKGLHDVARSLREELQGHVDATPAGQYEAIVLVYGLCNRALEGVQARTIPLVLPRAHDCITLYLGSRRRYDAEFRATPGTFYYSDDYLERGGTQSKRGSPEGSPRIIALGATTPINETYEELVARFGEDNAQYLMEVLGSWRQHYQRAAYIDTGLGKSGAYREQAERDAAERGWRFDLLRGDLDLIRRLLAGAWDDDFLVVQPGQRIVATYDERIVAAEQAGVASG
jgi:hypothetical protein